jgi:hypothetical protein
VKTSADRAAVPLLLVSALASSQPFGPSGSVFRVNTTTSGYQALPAVGMDGADSFVIAWKGAGVHDVLAQRYASSGAALGGEFRVNSSSSYPYSPAVTGSGTGHFTIVWHASELGIPPSVRARQFVSGIPQGNEFRVNETTGAYNQFPAVASNAAGDFVVIWGRAGVPTNTFDLYGRRFDAGGAPQSGEFRVSSSTTNAHSGAPSVARTPAGGFAVVWTPNTFPSAVGRVFVRRYDASGAEGAIFVANGDTDTATGTPAVAYDSSGNFLVVWNGGNVFAQRYDASGTSLGENFRVNTITGGYPAIATSAAFDSSGNFVVVWGIGAGYYAIYGRRYASSGAPLGDQFRINTVGNSNQRLGGLAMDGGGNFVVTWQRGSNPDADIYALRYCATLAGDSNGKNAIDVGDAFYLINALFAGGPAPLKGSDVNGDGKLDVLDVFYLINFLFAGGPSPACA